MAKKKTTDFKKLVQKKLKLKATATPKEIKSMATISPKGDISVSWKGGGSRVIGKTILPFKDILILLTPEEEK